MHDSRYQYFGMFEASHFKGCVGYIFAGLFFKFKQQHLSNYNHFHNILRLFNVLIIFPFTTSETMCDYYLETWYLRVASPVAERLPAGGAYVPTQEKKLGILGNKEISGKCLNPIE